PDRTSSRMKCAAEKPATSVRSRSKKAAIRGPDGPASISRVRSACSVMEAASLPRSAAFARPRRPRAAAPTRARALVLLRLRPARPRPRSRAVVAEGVVALAYRLAEPDVL